MVVKFDKLLNWNKMTNKANPALIELILSDCICKSNSTTVKTDFSLRNLAEYLFLVCF